MDAKRDGAEVQRTQRHQTYARRKQAGRCVTCGNPARPRGVLCRACTVRQARQQWARHEQGRCRSCGGPLDDPQRWHCAACRASSVAKQQAQYAARKAQGLCTRCGKQPVFLHYVVCERCYFRSKRYHRVSQARRRQARQEKGARA